MLQKMSQKDQKVKKSGATGDLDKRCTERTPRKCFGCVSEDHLIAKLPNPPKENVKRRKQVRFNEKINRACGNGENNSDKIYMHLWHVCLLMRNFLVEILVKICN